MAALAKADKVLEAAVDLAREAAVEIADLGAVGDHLGLTMVRGGGGRSASRGSRALRPPRCARRA